MQNKKTLVKLTAAITAGALGLTLTSGCTQRKKDKFYFDYSFSGEAYINRYDYISSEYINNYYLIEVYHTGLKKSFLYIAHDFKYTNGVSKYTNIFTNNKIAYNPDEEDYYDFINIIPLIDLLEEYNLAKDKYTYEDMQEIFKIIKENYLYQKNNAKIRIKERINN